MNDAENETVDGMVSVIMAAYNAEFYIEQAIRSVLGQSYKKLELIIINDASTDGVYKKISTFHDGRIRYIENENNLGVAKSRNKGISKARGEYIAFLDADDFWFPKKIEMQINKMKEAKLYCCHTAYERMSADFVQVMSTVPAKDKVFICDMLRSNMIGNLTGVYNVKFIGRVFQKEIGHEDYLMWLSIVQKSPSVGINEVLARYRVHRNGLSSNKIKAMYWHYKILRNELGLGFFKCLCFFISYLYRALLKRR